MTHLNANPWRWRGVRRALCACGAVGWVVVGPAAALAQDGNTVQAVAQVAPAVPQRDIRQWLQRLHEASRKRTYMGTFVVSAGNEIAASRIWHVCNGEQQLERIQTLTGKPRITLRRNDEVMTWVPEQRLVWKEKRDTLRLFPDLLQLPGQAIVQWYSAQVVGTERVADLPATVVDFVPKDAWRFGYRVWSEQTTGLALKLQTRDAQGRVLEQVAFTELDLQAPIKPHKLLRQMANTDGYQVLSPQLQSTTPEAEGWRLSADVPGFKTMGCHTRHDVAGSAPMQWVFSDGLATVSLFVETFDPQRHTKEQTQYRGATYLLSRRKGAHWVTAMGEVPADTLHQFVQRLERVR